jgi:hypothetical protein
MVTGMSRRIRQTIGWQGEQGRTRTHDGSVTLLDELMTSVGAELLPVAVVVTVWTSGHRVDGW